MSRPWSDCRSHGYRVKPGKWRGHSVRRVTHGDKYSMDPDTQLSVRTWGCLWLGRDPKETNKRTDGDCQGHSHPKLSAPLRGSNRPLLASTELAW